MRGKYQAEARACVTFAELTALILRFIVDHYHNSPHSGLDGETPRHCWLKLTKKYAPRSVGGKAHIRHGAASPTPSSFNRKASRSSATGTPRPRCKSCTGTFPSDYTVIVDGEDLGGVSLEMESGWLEVPGPDCMNGLSATVWDMAVASMRRENKYVEKLVEPVVLRAIGFAQRIAKPASDWESASA